MDFSEPSPTSVPAELARYPVVVRLPVQWGDQDSFGHVNNTVYFRWFESARIVYMARIGLFTGESDSGAASAGEQKPGLILAAIQCNFRHMTHFPDAVLVGARVSRIGRTSMVMDHAAYSEARRRMVAEGTSTVVMFDYTQQRPIAVPDDIRAAMTTLQGEIS